MAYEHTYNIPYFLIDRHRRLRATGLVQFLEDMAIRHSEACGVGLEYYYNNQVAWLLNKWDISVFRYPHYAEQIRIVTRPTSFRRFLGYRAFEVYDPNDHLLARGRSLWVYMNTRTRRPLAVDDSIIQAYGLSPNDQSPLEMQSPERPDAGVLKGFNAGVLEEPDAGVSKGPDDTNGPNSHNSGTAETEAGERSEKVHHAHFRVHTGDLDSNRHVNNTRYVQWALDTLPAHFTDTMQVHRIRVDYKKETTLGQKILSLADTRPLICDASSESNVESVSDALAATSSGIQTRHEIRNETGVACVASFDWYQP